MKNAFKKVKFLELTEEVYASEKLAKEINIDYDILKEYNNWYIYNGEYYYFKLRWDKIQIILNHLIGEEVAKLFSIPSAHFVLARANNEIGIASKNFRKPNINYIDIKSYKFFPYINPKQNILFLEQFFDDDGKYNQFIYDLLNLIAFHFYISLDDIDCWNSLFIKNEKSISLGEVFDMDCSFYRQQKDYYFYESIICNFEIPSKEFKELIDFKPEFKYIIKSILDFNMKKILDKIITETKINIPENYLEFYIEHDKAKKDFIRSLKL